VLDAAWRIDTHGAKAAKVEISTIKFYVAGTLQRVLDRALQTLGGRGMVDDTPIAWWYRHERAARIYDGPDEVHKAVVAREILARYGAKLS
jgi:alkylation response protein AidB-like acyl-CoA dehydrogenase